MEQAIKKAIEGGYLGVHENYVKTKEGFYSTLMDVRFWQALGKAEGWEDECDKCGTLQPTIENEIAEYGVSDCKIVNAYGKEHMMWLHWKATWHRFIDHIASGGSMDEFFEQLLTK